MAFFEWNNKLLIGVDTVDRQHQHLIALINSLHLAMKEGSANELLGSVLNDLLEYTYFHFESEEELMLSSGFPQYEDHRTEHDVLTKRTLLIKAKYDSGKSFITQELMNFLREWFQLHIMNSDIRIAQHIKIIYRNSNKYVLNNE